MLELRGLAKSYDGTPAIVDFSVDVDHDEYLTLLGPSGSGKSTLLRLIAGLEQPDSGSITLSGEEITDLPTYSRGLGFVQQKFALFPHLSVRDNVAFGLRFRQIDPITDEGEVAKRVNGMLDLVGLDELGDRMVNQLSGGQKQRVSLARTLVCEPKICLLDEPLGALDANLRERMTVELRRIRSTLGVTFMHVTGNEAEALAMGDRMIVLDQGRAIQIDKPAAVFSRPETVDVAKFVNNYNILSGNVANGCFRGAGAHIALPAASGTASHYAVRFDRVSMRGDSAQIPSDRASIEVEFLAAEFLGSRVAYFFQRPDGGVFEMECHLSIHTPVKVGEGEKHILSWSLDDVLLYGADGRLLGCGQ